MRSFHPRASRHQRPLPTPSWDIRLAPSQPTTPQQLADIIIATDPRAFRTISALDAAMCKANAYHRLGFLAVSIREAARHAVRADARGISPAYELITSRDYPDQDAVRLAWTAFGSRFADGGHAIEVMRAWMVNTRKKLLHEALERRQMPVIVGDAQGCSRLVEALLEPLDDFCRHLRAATISPTSIMGDDGLCTVPVAVVEIGEGDRLDVLRCLTSSPTITLPGARSPIKVPVETSFIGVADADVTGCENLVLRKPCPTLLRIDHELLWRSA